MTKYNFDATTSRVVPLTDDNANWGKHFGQADMVIEVRWREERKGVVCVLYTQTCVLTVYERRGGWV